MPAIDITPKNLRPFRFHGLALDHFSGDQAIDDCPFCGREDKFYVTAATGQWQCKSCQIGSAKGGGNLLTFIQLLFKHSDDATVDYGDLQGNRKLLFPETLTYWGACRSIISGHWLVPGYSVEGKLIQLYRYSKTAADGRMALLGTPELKHGLLGVPRYDPKRPNVYLCEGPWDAMALWESMRSVKYAKDGDGKVTDQLQETGSESSSLLASASVLAAPSCTVFRDDWWKLLGGKNVYLMYDNDLPRVHPRTGAPIAPTALEAMRRVTGLLSSAEKKPKTVHYLCWGEGGIDSTLPSGYDVRDWLSQESGLKTIQLRAPYLNTLLAMTKPIPAEWVTGSAAMVQKSPGSVEIECAACESWEDILLAWQKAMHFSRGLEGALAVMLASIMSVTQQGDTPLWVKIIGPPSCGKSTLCEAVSVCKDYVFANSTMRGFHSGFKSDKDGKEDNGLIPKIKNKTLVTKDGDTLLSSPGIAQILSEARDLYDCVARVHYRHGISRDYADVRMTWILCGTDSLRQLDSSELGERFLDYCIMEGIDVEIEREVARRQIFKVLRTVATPVNHSISTRQDQTMTLAKQLTGGYVRYLRENASTLLEQVVMTEEVAEKIIDLGAFVAHMRARPSKRQDESDSREFSARLVGQLGRLAMCLAAVYGRKEVDNYVLARTTKVALDTARGRVLDLTKQLYSSGLEGMAVSGIVMVMGQPEEKTKTLLRFLKKIKVTEWYNKKVANSFSPGRLRWRLTAQMRTLYKEVIHATAE